MKILLFFMISVTLVPAASAREQILSFHSEIHVDPDGSMAITETIRVKAEQDRIKRGIYRDFPTRYRDPHGNRYRIGFDITGVSRDRAPEHYFTEDRSNGVRVYFGRESVILKPGEYTYEFSYMTDRQLGFYKSHDELYWNVTGNEWDFPIAEASARVFLPPGIPSGEVTAEAYTGKAGSKQQDFEEYRYRGGTVFIQATTPLARHEGFTIVVTWPKGFIIEPSIADKLQYFYHDNRHIVFATGGLLLVLVYYLLIWNRVGRDPEPDIIIARYQPPDGFSPASLRYIERMGYDNTCFAAALINLAVKGYLTITEYDKEYTLEKTGKEVEMVAGESALVNKLFAGSKTRALEQSNHKYLRDALDAHKAALSRDYEKKYFQTNKGYFLAGLVLSIALLIVSVLMMPVLSNAGGAAFMTVWLSGWSFGVFMLVTTAIRSWRQVHGFVTALAAIQITFFACIFVGIEIIVIGMFYNLTSWMFILMVLVMILINWLFYELLKAPTLAGRRLLDRMDGFRRYIDIAEKHELEYRHPKGRCPELFEAYLPYALALGVEQKWGEQFADVLVKASTREGRSYRPLWYRGSNWDNNHIGGFSRSLGSQFTGAIASSSTASGSSSGSSGGGFSGGGGGGW